jgi:hypothetical protein
MPEDSVGATDATQASDTDDARLYVPRSGGWEVHLKGLGEREYCHFKAPGQDYYHLLMPGEIYLQHGYDKYCLNCAIRNEVATRNRLFWQRSGAHPTD